MKVALSGMVLGASMLGANAASLSGTATFANVDGTPGGSIGVEGNTVTASGGTLNCEADFNRGTAYGTYGDIETDDLNDYQIGSKLAYFCGLTGQKIDDAQGAVQSNDRVLIELTGTGNCTPTLSGYVDVNADADGRIYAPVLKAQVEYSCYPSKSHVVGGVTADLFIEASPDATTHNIVGNMVKSSASYLERTAGHLFESTWTALYDLGANDPHSAYYVAGSSCTGGDMCMGKIKLQAAGLSKDISSDITQSGLGWKDSSVAFSGVSADQCDQTDRTDTPGLTEFKACGVTQNDALTADALSGASRASDKGLLTEFKCPFKDSNGDISTPAVVAECIAEGKRQTLSNQCSDAGENDYDSTRVKALHNDYSVNLRFNDPAYKAAKPTVSLTAPSAQTVSRDKATVDWLIDVTGDLSDVKDLRVESDTFKQYVSVENGKIAVTGAPAETLILNLKGATLLRTCLTTDDTLASVTVTVSKTSLQDAGKFEMKENGVYAPCLGKFEYSLGQGMTVTNIHAPIGSGSQKQVVLKFCQGTEAAVECKNNDRSDTASQQFVVIEGACDNVQAGDVGALVEFGSGYDAAPIICPGTCQAGDLGLVKLDWGIDFALSISDDSSGLDDNNKLTVSHQSAYKGVGVGSMDRSEGVEYVSQVSYLAPNNQCSVDGKVYGSAAATCLISDLAGLTKATEFVDRFKTCGQTDSSAPSVYLISHVKVELTDGSEVHFCNAKILSIAIENMRGEATDSIGIIAEEADALDAMSAAFSFIGYQECESGLYQLVATMDIETTASDLTIANDEQVFAQLEDNEVNSPAYSATDKTLTFSTVCADICSADQGAYDDQYDLNIQLADSANSENTFDITAQIKVDGTPCGESDSLERGDVTLDLYGITGSDCDPNYKVDDANVNAADHELCASLTVNGFGSGSLTIVSETLTRASPNSEPEEINGTTFFKSSYTNAEIQSFIESQVSRDLQPEDAMTTYTLTVVWEQALSRRLLRSEFVFGAGDHEAKSSLFILPASAQIEDAVQSLDSKPAGSTDDAADDAAEDEGLSGSEITWIIVGSCAGVGLIAYGVMVASKNSKYDRLKDPQASGYSAVRRSERFSTMNF